MGFMVSEKKRGYVISLDLEKAFDRVEHEVLGINGFVTEVLKLTMVY